MTVRSRLINFRVTDEEFRRLKTASVTHNARCLSDFARSAILERVQAPPDAPAAEGPAATVADQLQAFERRLARLESHISRLSDALTELKFAAVPTGAGQTQ